LFFLTQIVIARFMRATQFLRPEKMDHPDKPGDDEEKESPVRRDVLDLAELDQAVM
jgi:hypothetical protein